MTGYPGARSISVSTCVSGGQRIFSVRLPPTGEIFCAWPNPRVESRLERHQNPSRLLPFLNPKPRLRRFHPYPIPPPPSRSDLDPSRRPHLQVRLRSAAALHLSIRWCTSRSLYRFESLGGRKRVSGVIAAYV